MWYDSGTQRPKGKKENRRKPSVYAGFRRFEIQNSIIPTRRIKSISKLFCLENIIRGGFI
jgi:hypothetical protein